MISLLFIISAFLCGTLPFSVWLGKLFVGLDVRTLGDSNPGAANAFRTGNRLVGLLALLMDVSKAAAPVGLAYFNLGFRDAPMFFIAVAPLLGHVFSPFLGFRGGKGLSTALGIWIGLTVWKASLAGVIGAVIGIAFLTPPGWAVLLALAGILGALLAWLPDPLLRAVLGCQTLILVWTHRHDLSHWPHIRPWLARHFQPGKG